jgi:hypothetical protein
VRFVDGAHIWMRAFRDGPLMLKLRKAPKPDMSDRKIKFICELSA